MTTCHRPLSLSLFLKSPDWLRLDNGAALSTGKKFLRVQAISGDSGSMPIRVGLVHAFIGENWRLLTSPRWETQIPAVCHTSMDLLTMQRQACCVKRVACMMTALSQAWTSHGDEESVLECRHHLHCHPELGHLWRPDCVPGQSSLPSIWHKLSGPGWHECYTWNHLKCWPSWQRLMPQKRTNITHIPHPHARTHTHTYVDNYQRCRLPIANCRSLNLQPRRTFVWREFWHFRRVSSASQYSSAKWRYPIRLCIVIFCFSMSHIGDYGSLIKKSQLAFWMSN